MTRMRVMLIDDEADIVFILKKGLTLKGVRSPRVH